MVYRRCNRRPKGIEDTAESDDDQDQGQERRQILAHAVHDIILVRDKEEGNDKISDDQWNERRRRQIALDAELDSRRTSTGNRYERTDQHERCQKDIIRILPYPACNGMDVTIEPDDDECKNRQENARQCQSSQAGHEITTTVQAELRRENQVASAKIGGKESKP